MYFRVPACFVPLLFTLEESNNYLGAVDLLLMKILRVIDTDLILVFFTLDLRPEA